jgi:hypothetical protein
VLTERSGNSKRRLEELIKALDRERSEANDLHRRHIEETRRAHERDRQVLIERRRFPR